MYIYIFIYLHIYIYIHRHISIVFSSHQICFCVVLPIYHILVLVHRIPSLIELQSQPIH